jgi:hypothetical protein
MLAMNVSMVWEDSEIPEERGLVVCDEETESVLEVEPLATMGLNLTGSDEDDAIILEPSEWVRGKYHEFEEYLGASYEGYEDEFLNLLKSIDARWPQQPQDKKSSMKGAKSGGKGSRELKGLLSTVNYDTRTARRRIDPRERVLALVQWT